MRIETNQVNRGMERIDAQTIITLLLEDETLRQQVLEAIEPVEVKRLYEQMRQLLRKARELEMRQAYLEAVVKELQARQEETEQRVKQLDAIVRAIIQGQPKPSDSHALGFVIVRKRPTGDTMLN